MYDLTRVDGWVGLQARSGTSIAWWCHGNPERTHTQAVGPQLFLRPALRFFSSLLTATLPALIYCYHVLLHKRKGKAFDLPPALSSLDEEGSPR